jgi:CHAT domain-containing protein
VAVVSAGCNQYRAAAAAKIYQDARLKFEQGNLAAAGTEAGDAYHQYSRYDQEWAWRFRVLDAEVLVWRGLSKDALALLDDPLPTDLAYGDVAVRKLMVQGLADCFLQRFDDADHQLSAAEQLAHSNQPDLLGEIAISRGTLAFLRRDYGGAESAFHESLRIARARHQSFLEAKSLGSLGLVTMREERYDESIDWDDQALELSRSLGARTATAKILGNIGWDYYKMGDHDAALEHFLQARKDSAELGLQRDEFVWITNVGNVEYDQRSYAPAQRDFNAALTLARTLEDKSGTSVCLNNLALVELSEGNYDEAERDNRESLALKRATGDRGAELNSILTDGRIAEGKKDYKRAESDWGEVIGDRSADSSLRWQAEAAMAETYAVEKRTVDAQTHFLRAMATIDAARSAVKREEFRLSFLSGTISFYDDYIGFFVAQRNIEKALEAAELSRARALGDGLGLKPGAVSAIKPLRSREIAKEVNGFILDYWLGLDHSYLWVITPERVELFTLPPAGEIDPLVQAYRQALVGSRDVLETQNAAGRKLYDLLVAPAAKIIPKGARVTILPDGSLYGLNFETLLAPSPQLHYWIEDVDVSYANSLTLLAVGASRHAASAKKLLLVGDPVSPDAEFPKLPQAATEMSEIENYFPAAERTVFAGAEATPDSYLKSEAAGFSYIHFVAHGTASRTSPLDSAVILSRRGDDYKLYARDIIQHPLHAELVTISACHGEGVRTYSGEGLVGLSWAFLRAGAHGVIAALWEVNDNSTPQLMDHLYSEIGKGVPPDAALRDAKLALLHSGGVYRRPFYWAPFELYRGS